MPVQVNIEIANYYSWDDADVAWEQASYPWKEAGVRLISISASDEFVVQDISIKDMSKRTSQKLAVRDKKSTGMEKQFNPEFIFVSETYWDNILFNLFFVETIKPEELIKKNFIHGIHQESFGVSDKQNKMFGKNNIEPIDLIDLFQRSFQMSREFKENINPVELLQKEFSITSKEHLEVYAAFIKACDGVLSNISVNETTMTIEDFKTLLSAPPSYSKFVEFKVGEYEYEDALVRVMMTTNVKQTQPLVANVVMHVDIPDTDDRGDVEITDVTAPTKVYFNKFYYNPPEVNVTLKVGNTADGVLTPNVVTTEGKDDNGRYFEVELWDENWVNRKTGRISWVSKGY